MEEMAEASSKDDKEDKMECYNSSVKMTENYTQSNENLPENHAHNESGIGKSLSDSAYLYEEEDSINVGCDKTVAFNTSEVDGINTKELDVKLNNNLENNSVKMSIENATNDSANNETDACFHLGFMKKDDSGIDIGRSPTSIRDMSLASDVENSEVSELFTDSSVASRDNSESVGESFTDSGAMSNDKENVESGGESKDKSDITNDVKNNTESVNNVNDVDKNSNNKKDNSEIEPVIEKSAIAKKDSSEKPVKTKKKRDKEKMSETSKMDTSTSNQKDSDIVMPQTIDTDDSEVCGTYDVNMSSAKDSDDEMENVFKSTKTKRKFRRPRIDSDSDTDSKNEESNESDTSSSSSTESDATEAQSRSKDNTRGLDSDDDDNEKVESKKSESDNESDSEDDSDKKPKQTWKAVFDLREREFGYSNKSPPSIFREKVQGSLQMVQRFKLQSKMEYHEGCVNALHFNRIGTLLASGSDDLNIVLWNWIRSRPSLIYDSGHRSNVFQAKFMPFSGDCHVVSCARDGQIRLAELSLTGVCKGTKKIAQHRGAAHKLALEFDSPHVFLSCGEDALVYEIDLRQDKPNKLSLTKENDRKVPLYSIHSNPSNSFEFCVGGRDHFVRIYDKRKIGDEEKDTGLVKKYCPHHLVESDVKANVTCAVYNYNGTEVMGSYNDEDIYLFSNQHSDGAEYIHRYTGHRNNATVKGVNFYGPKSEFVVSGSDCGHVYLWDTGTEEVVQFLEGDEGGVINVLEPHPFAPVLATSGLDHDVKIWSPTAEEATSLKGLKKVLKRNKKEREEERVNEPDMIDGQMMWYIMHQLGRVRRRQREAANRDGDNDNNSTSSENSDYDSDGLEEMPDRLQCAPS